MWSHFILLALALAASLEAGVVPQFSCWFPTFANGTRDASLVFSYNNTNANDTVLPLGPGVNQFLPVQLDGQQDDYFKQGPQLFTVTIAGTQSLFDQGGTVQWVLDDGQVTVTGQQASDPALRCDTAFQGVCPSWIDGFCQNQLYCDGAETCFTVSMFGARSARSIGHCIQPQSGVQCTAPQRCSESALRCVTPATRAPTPAPTQAPVAPPNIQPTFFCWFTSQESVLGDVTNLALGYNSLASGPLVRPVTQDATPPSSARNYMSHYNGQQTTDFQPGFEPLSFTIKDIQGVLAQPGGQIVWSLTQLELVIDSSLLVPERECSFVNTQPTGEGGTETGVPTNNGGDEVSDADVQCTLSNTTCTDFDTFCHGPTVCNTTSQQCVPVNESYNPCLGVQSQIVTDEAATPITLECVEHLQLCVAYVNCSVDDDCQDGVFCNGREYCFNRTCYGQPNMTIEKLCGTANAYCYEGQNGDGRCVATNQSINPRVVTGIVGGILLVMMILVVGLYFYFNRSRGSGNSRTR